MFISVEGVDGAGKTTFVHALCEALRERGFSVIQTTEPGGISDQESNFPQKIRDIFRYGSEHLPTLSEILLLLSARVYNLDRVIRPALEAKTWVVVDRFNDSTYAYQGYGSGCSIDLLDRLIVDARCDLVPDITFFIDVHPDVSLKRIKVCDAIEGRSAGFHGRVYMGYVTLYKKFCSRIVRLDGQEGVAILVNMALTVLHSRDLLG